VVPRRARHGRAPRRHGADYVLKLDDGRELRGGPPARRHGPAPARGRHGLESVGVEADPEASMSTRTRARARMMMGELLTLRQQKLPVKVVVLNNSSLAFVELEMKANGIVNFGTDLDNPSFALVARAVGCTPTASSVPASSATVSGTRSPTVGRRSSR
jgi:hypothetical protein